MKNIQPLCPLFLGLLLTSGLSAQYGDDDSSTASSLLDQLRKKGRQFSFESLPSGSTDPKVEKPLLQLNDSSWSKRLDAVRALGELGEKARPAAPRLASILSQPLVADSHKNEIIVALVKIDRSRVPTLVPALAKLFAGRDKRAKQRLLAALRPESGKSLLSQADVERFISSLHFAKQQASKPRIELTLLVPPSKKVDRESALFILAGLRHRKPAVRRKTAELLENAETRTLTSAERALRLSQGINALSQTVVPEAADHLETLLKHESDSAVRSAAQRALKHIQSRY